MLLCNTSLENNRQVIMKKNSWLILIPFFLFTVPVIQAQEIPELITDRPVKTESAIVIPLDFVQIETGFVYQRQKYSEGSNTFENDNLYLASTLVRYGVNSFLELRFGGEYFFGQSFTNGLKSDLQGIQNLLFGTKIQFRKNEKILSNVGIIIQTLIPFGNEKLRPDNFAPIFLVSLDQKIYKDFSFGINLGTGSDIHSGKYSFVYSGSLGYRINSKLDLFLELYGSALPESVPTNNFDCGITYQFKSNILIDFSMGTSLMGGITDLFGGFGLSIRVPE